MQKCQNAVRSAASKKTKKPSNGADAQQPKPRARSIASGAAPGDSEKDYIVFKLIRERMHHTTAI